MQLTFRDQLFAGALTLGLALVAGVGMAAEDEPKSASDAAAKEKASGEASPDAGTPDAASPDAGTPDAASKTLKISGIVEAIVAEEISPDTEQIASFKIKRIVPHGTSVSKGQNVVWFETEEIDKKIKDAETDLRLSKLTMDDDEFNYKQFLETQELDRAAAQRARKYAQQEYDNYVQVDRDRQTETVRYNLKSSRHSLEYAREELEQLEQMYKEDDLTEASEEIVLKRAQRAVESAQFRLAATEIQSERSLEQSIPRSQVQQEESLARAELAHKKSMRDLASARQRRDIEMARKRDNLKEQEEKLAELREERKRIVLTSPINGIVLHGELKRGKLSEKPSVLKPGAKVTPQQVVATVVSPKKLQIRVDLEEKNLQAVTVDADCKVTFKAFPGYTTTGTVKMVSAVPYAGSKFDCVVALRPKKQQPAILPTMTCELEFGSEEKGKDDAESKDDE